MTVDATRVESRTAVWQGETATATDNSGLPGRVHEAIALQSQRTPDRVAVVAGTSRLTYADLDRRADDVAGALAAKGVGRGHLVGVCLDRDEWLVPALVGVWKAGAAYVPLDPAYPAERLRFMAEDSAFSTVITSAALRRTAVLTGAETILVDDVAPGDGAPHVPGDPSDAAYVIYTSGSTGTPKGVVVEHRNTLNLLRWEASAYSAEELGGMLASFSVCFDGSITQLFVPLVAGGTVILADNLLALPTLPAREEVTTINGVPSALSVLLREPATVVLPDTAPELKVSAARALGAEVVITPPALREITCLALADRLGATVVRSDDFDIIAGHGSAGTEIGQGLPRVGTILVPVCNGGLLAGVAVAAKAVDPSIRVIGVEPELAADGRASFRSGRRTAWPVEETYRTRADGLRAPVLGALAWEHILRYVDDMVTVSEDGIGAAVGLLRRELGEHAEPSGAVATAAYLAHGPTLPAGPVVAILSGGNAAVSPDAGDIKELSLSQGSSTY